jgi:hypothetical protein
MYNPVTWLHHNRTWLPLALSTLSLGVSAVALGWNVYRNMIFKPRLAVSFFYAGRDRQGGLANLTTGEPEMFHSVHEVRLSIVNYGPGRVRCEYAVVRVRPAWQALFGRSTWRMLLKPDGTRYRELPAFIEVADRLELPMKGEAFFLEENAFKRNPTQFGVRDSYGRFHWAPKRDLREARKYIRQWRAEQAKSEPPNSTFNGQNET